MIKNRNKIISIILSIIVVVVSMSIVSVNAISTDSTGFSIIKPARPLKKNDSLYNDNYTAYTNTYLPYYFLIWRVYTYNFYRKISQKDYIF